VADIPLSPNAHRTPTERLDFFNNMLDHASTLPGVRSAAAASFLPVSGGGGALYFNIQGRPPKGHDYSLASYRTVSPGYFETLQIPLIQGRFVQANDRETAPPVVVINATMAKTFFPDINPLGQHIQIGGLPNSTAPWMEIVGIAGDVKQALSSEAASEMYVPYRQADKTVPVLAMSLVMRTGSDPRSLAGSVRSIVHDLDPNQPVVKIRTMDENVSDSISQPRFRTVLLAIFAGLALVLSSIGIFSVMAYSVAQRTRELGVRMALGASRGRILQLVLVHGFRLTVIGLVIGLAATFAFTKYVSSMLFSVRAYDPFTLAGMAIVVIVVSLLACYIPARRATRLDPIVVLRHD
jgi:putative ABC transport system permease protein